MGRASRRGPRGRSRGVQRRERRAAHRLHHARRSDCGRDAQGLHALCAARSPRPSGRAVRARKRPLRPGVLREERTAQRESQYDGLPLHGRAGASRLHGADRDDASARGRRRVPGLRVRDPRRRRPRPRLPGGLRRALREHGAPHGQPEHDRHRLVEYLVSEREGIPEREHVHHALVPLPRRKFDRGPGHEREVEGQEGIDGRELGGVQAAVLLVGLHRARQPAGRRHGFRHGGSGVGDAQVLCARDGRALHAADRGLRLRLLLRPQQVRHTEEGDRAGRRGAAPGASHSARVGHLRLGEPLVRDSGLRLPAQLRFELRRHHSDPRGAREAHHFANDLQELPLDGQDARHQTRGGRAGEEVPPPGGRHEAPAGDDGAL